MINVQLSVIVWTVICFILLMIILRNLLFEPVLKIMDKRQARIDRAADRKQEIEARMQQNEQQLAEQRQQYIADRIAADKQLLQQIRSEGKKQSDQAQKDCLAAVEEYRESLHDEYEHIVQSVAPEMETAAAIFVQNILSHKV